MAKLRLRELVHPQQPIQSSPHDVYWHIPAYPPHGECIQARNVPTLAVAMVPTIQFKINFVA